MAGKKLPPSKLPPEDQPESSKADSENLMAELGADEAVAAAPRSRWKQAEALELTPISLVGSFFIRVENGEAIWWGCVVSEVQPGTYLVEVDSGLENGRAQVLYDAERMIAKNEGYEFRFFDTWDECRNAFRLLSGVPERREA